MENKFKFNDFIKSDLCRETAESVDKQPENPSEGSVSVTLLPIGEDELDLAIEMVVQGIKL